MSILKPETKSEQDARSAMAGYAENFFRRIGERKEREIEIRENHNITAMRKFYRKIKPYMKKAAIKFIVCTDNPNGKHVFETESFRKAKNDWICLRRDCDWYSLFAIDRDGVKWKVDWYYSDYNREEIIKFFGNDGEEVCEVLIKLTHWWHRT